MAELWTFREPSLCRYVRRELLRNVLLDFTPIIPTTACHQRNYLETDSRYIVWITKYRRKVLRGEVAKRVREIVREECRKSRVEIFAGPYLHGSCAYHGLDSPASDD